MTDGSGRVLVRWRRQLYDAVNVWQVLAPVPASEIYTFITGAQAGNAITVEVRFQNGLGALSPAFHATHTVVANAVTVRTAQITADAVYRVDSDPHDFAGATFSSAGYTTQRTFTVTPVVDCIIEFSASIVATNALPDTAHNIEWRVSAGGGADTTLGYCNSDSTARQNFSTNVAFAATGGVSLDFKIVTRGTAPSIALYQSDLRVGQVKR
jgi:hypothetical protein